MKKYERKNTRKKKIFGQSLYLTEKVFQLEHVHLNAFSVLSASDFTCFSVMYVNVHSLQSKFIFLDITRKINLCEHVLVKKSSEQARLSLSTFVRNVCVGYRVESKEDMQARHELIKGLADMGRLGGLYKLALSENKDTLQVRPLLRELEMMQSRLKEKIRKL